MMIAMFKWVHSLQREVLDNDTVLEIYDKYYKYTATTNKAGDYMIFGIPTVIVKSM